MKHTLHSTFRISMTSLVLAAAVISAVGGSAGVAIAQQGTGTIRVSTMGSDEPGCGSEVAPCRTIQYGIRRAVSGDTILVAQGTYTFDPAQTPCFEFGTTPAVVCIHGKDLTLLGGYSGTDWSAPDPMRYPVIVDGQQANRGVLAWNAASLRMEGFTIQNGRSQGATSGGDLSTFAYGGGVRVVEMDLTLRNMVFRNNQAVGGDTAQAYGGSGIGGGLAVSNADPTTPIDVVLENITLDGNQAKGGQGAQLGGTGIGGGMHFSGQINVSGDALTLTNNTAAAGSTNGSGYISGRGYSDAQGGGAAFYMGPQATFQHIVATGNQARGGNVPNGDGGGAYGGAFFFEHVSVSVLDGVLQGNLAQGGSGINATGGYGGLTEGGAIQSDDSEITLNRVSVIANIARSGNGSVYKGAVGGGGLALTHFTENGQIHIVNSIVADNRAELGTGATLWGGGGGGLFLQGTTGSIVNSTIANNYTSNELLGQAIVMTGGDATTTDLDYTIIANHTNSVNGSALYVQAGATVNLNHGLWSNNTLNTNAAGNQPGVFNGLTTMKTGSAGFVSVGAPNYNYHIQGNSAARDQASGSSVAIDLDTQSRTLYSTPDIGADEYVPFVISVSPIADGILFLSWIPDVSLVASVHHYTVSYTHEAGAGNAAEGASPINVGSAKSFVLTGLTNGKQYTFSVEARNAANTVLETSYSVSAKPVENFISLPLVLR
jgi:hypothetical protein